MKVNKVTWCQRIEKAHHNHVFAQAPVALKFRPPVLQQDITDLEKLLEIEFPSDLRGLLLESNGVMDCLQLGQQRQEIGWLFWPVSEIKQRNQWLRSDAGFSAYGRRFDDLLFFADAGDGTLFGYFVASDIVEQEDIFIWYPIENVVNPLGFSLETFIDEWIGGKLAI